MIVDKIISLRNEIKNQKTLMTVAYLYLQDKNELMTTQFNFFEEEEIAYLCYKSMAKIEDVEFILQKERSNWRSNPYKLLGYYLCCPESQTILRAIKEKFEQSDSKIKYLISRFIPFYLPLLTAEVEKCSDNSVSFLYKITNRSISNDEFSIFLSNYLISSSDLIDLLIIEDIHQSLCKKLLPTNKSHIDFITGILLEFNNSTNKLTTRRKDHSPFEINNEYDVQDLLYLILKCIYPSLKDEDPTPKVGISSNKIDLIIREYGILIEVKMIKQNNKDEKEVIKELKIDIESYTECQWLQHLICFVYDPFRKTKDKHNFDALNGTRSKNGKTFEVIVILNP